VQDSLSERFLEQRPRLRAVAYRMLGSLSDAEDALQETSLRLQRTDPSTIENPDGFLTTVVGRVALNMLRARKSRREEPVGGFIPDPIIDRVDSTDPEHEVLLADCVGLAMAVVLETLTPAERLAFVLHDMFAVAFDDIAPIIDRSPEATRQLASRARRRVRDERTTPDPDLDRQREVVDAFYAAARQGDFDALVAVLDPDVVLRSDSGTGRVLELHGAEAVANRARSFARAGLVSHMALVNGAAGAVSMHDGQPFSVAAFTVRDGRIVEMDFLADRERLARLDLVVAG
jgi:RNA polymerase sigma-70 factor (ECF subfamily)